MSDDMVNEINSEADDTASVSSFNFGGSDGDSSSYTSSSDDEMDGWQQTEESGLTTHHRFENIMSTYLSINDGNMDMSEKTQQFIRFCVQRELYFWNCRRVINFMDTDHHLVAMKNFLLDSESEDGEATEEDEGELDVNHPVCFYFYNTAIRCGDSRWLRLIVEQGLDVSQLEQGALMRWLHASKDPDSHPVLRYDFSTNQAKDVLEMPRYLIETLDINPYRNANRSDNLFLSHLESAYYNSINFKSIMHLPFYRYLLNVCGYIAIDMTCHRSPLIKNAQEAIEDEIFAFLTVLIENDLHSNYNENTHFIKTKKRKRELVELFSGSDQCDFCERIGLAIWQGFDMLVSTDHSNLTERHEYLLLRLLEHNLLKTTGYREGRMNRLEQGVLLKRRLLAAGEDYNDRMLNLSDEGSVDEGLPQGVDDADGIEMEVDERVYDLSVRVPLSYYSFRDCHRSILLTRSVIAGFQDVVRKLLSLSKDYGDDVIKKKEHQRYVNTAMMSVRSLSMLKYLVEEEGADVNYVDRRTQHTLPMEMLRLYQVMIEPLSMIRYLYEEAGFTMTEHISIWKHGLPTNHGKTILQLAMRTSNALSFLDAVLCFGYGYKMTFVSNHKGEIESIRCDNIDEPLLQNRTMNPLMFAIVQEFESLFNMTILEHFLIHHKANVNARDNDGNTALIHAIKMNKIHIAKTLIYKYNGDIHQENNAGESAYSLAPNHVKAAFSFLL